VDTETVFEGASLGKSIVALAVLRLIEKGKLPLDSTADAIVPYTELNDPRKSRITVRMLLSHTSGLTFGQAKLDADPGVRFSYSTEGFRYLQRVVEKKLGERLETWAQRELFIPLKMNRTSFVYAERFTKNRARGRNWLMVGQEYMTNAAGTGAFDLITTSQNYARLWEGVLSGKIIRPKTLALMFTPQKKITREFYDAAIPKKSKADLACGLGILLQKQKSRWIGFQWGDNGGTTGLLLIDPRMKDAVVYFANAQDGNHVGVALASAAGMKEEALTWVGYEQYDSKSRLAWKKVTAALDRDSKEGLAKYNALLTQDSTTMLALSRNLGYFNRFKGRIIESEPFFRNAATVERDDTDLLGDWAESLVLIGNVEEAASVQEKAIKRDASLAKDYTLPVWVKAAKIDLADLVSPDGQRLAEAVGRYGDYAFEIGSDGALTLVTKRDRKRLIPTRSGDFLSTDLVCRVRFANNNVSLTIAGKSVQEIPKTK
jgi:CubicO group peptidase (beta-lactamase class C family)